MEKYHEIQMEKNRIEPRALDVQIKAILLAFKFFSTLLP